MLTLVAVLGFAALFGLAAVALPKGRSCGGSCGTCAQACEQPDAEAPSRR
jgi:hypothetical protein